jgi:hypothetical protein
MTDAAVAAFIILDPSRINSASAPGERIRTVVEKWLEDVSARDCQIPFFAKDAVAVSVLTMCTNMLRGDHER